MNANFFYLINALLLLGIGIFCGCPWDPRPVFLGDANNDGIVNHYDLLAIGLHYNATGTPRDASGNHTADWQQTIGGLNAKYADCDGNGIVNEADTAVISQHYGKKNSTYKGALMPTENSPKLELTGIVESSTINRSAAAAQLIQSGSTKTDILRLSFAIKGTVKLDTIKGIAFRVKTGRATFMGFAEDSYNATWLGQSNDLLYKVKMGTNFWDLSIVHKDNSTMQSNHVVENLGCIVTIDIGIKNTLGEFTVEEAVLMGVKGTLIPLAFVPPSPPPAS